MLLKCKYILSKFNKHLKYYNQVQDLSPNIVTSKKIIYIYIYKAGIKLLIYYNRFYFYEHAPKISQLVKFNDTVYIVLLFQFNSTSDLKPFSNLMNF